jgi:predicted HicB family RNase H-like nuclease
MTQQGGLLKIPTRAAMMAEAHGKSLNSWVIELLANVD